MSSNVLRRCFPARAAPLRFCFHYFARTSPYEDTTPPPACQACASCRPPGSASPRLKIEEAYVGEAAPPRVIRQYCAAVASIDKVTFEIADTTASAYVCRSERRGQ